MSPVDIHIKAKRDLLLRNSDWTDLPHSPLSEESKTAWQIYRQALRDLPQNNPTSILADEIEWPVEPNL